jgi:hypothetical protein
MFKLVGKSDAMFWLGISNGNDQWIYKARQGTVKDNKGWEKQVYFETHYLND